MKKSVIYSLLLLWLPIMGAAQDETTKPKTVYELLRQVSGEEYKPVVVDWSEIQRHIEDTSFWFDISCDMLTLPGPLTAAEATITLTSTADAPDVLARDYDLLVSTTCKDIEWPGDTRFIWHGPRKKGDTYTIPVRFTPLASGHQSFTIELRYPNGASRWELLMRVAWCLDEEGNVLYLRNTRRRPGNPCPFHPLMTVFFGQDSVSIGQRLYAHGTDSVFNSRFTITPPLHIGDTSTIRYYLTPNYFIPDGIGFRLSTEHMRVTRLPERVDVPINAGETIELTVDVVPAAVREPQWIELLFGPDMHRAGPGKHYQTIGCTAFFNDDGSLRYIYDGLFDPVDDSYLPSSFPEAEGDGRWVSRLFRQGCPPPDSTDLR